MLRGSVLKLSVLGTMMISPVPINLYARYFGTATENDSPSFPPFQPADVERQGASGRW